MHALIRYLLANEVFLARQAKPRQLPTYDKLLWK